METLESKPRQFGTPTVGNGAQQKKFEEGGEVIYPTDI